MLERFFVVVDRPGKTSRTMFTRLRFPLFVLPLVLPLGLVLGCRDDSRPADSKDYVNKPLNFKSLASVKLPPSAAPSGSAEAPAAASAMPSASAMPEASASAAAPGTKTAAPSASAKAEPAPKKESTTPAASASAAAPPTTASAAASAISPTTGLSPADLVAAQVDAIFLGKNTFSAKFKQEHTQKVAGVTKKSTGVFFFERPNKMSFRYDPPSQNRIVSDGKTLKVYIGEDKQMFVQSVEKTEYPGAFAFLMGKGMGPSFNFSFNDKAKFDGGPVLLGKPKEATPHYDSVLFYVDKMLLEKKDPGVIRRILIVDPQGNRNRFDLEAASQPEKIDPAEFTFTPPPGTNITQN